MYAREASRMSATKRDMTVTLNAVQLTCVTAWLKLKVEEKVGIICLELGKIQCLLMIRGACRICLSKMH